MGGGKVIPTPPSLLCTENRKNIQGGMKLTLPPMARHMDEVISVGANDVRVRTAASATGRLLALDPFKVILTPPCIFH
jgi:hypothetical protein